MAVPPQKVVRKSEERESLQIRRLSHGFRARQHQTVVAWKLLLSLPPPPRGHSLQSSLRCVSECRMADHIACPQCGRVVLVPDEFLGRQVRCPQCHGIFTAGATDIPAAPHPRRANVQTGWEAELDLRDGNTAASEPKRWYEANESGPTRFQSGAGLATATKILLGVNLLTSIVTLGSRFMQYQLATRLLDGEPVRAAELQDDHIRSVVVTVMHLIVYAAAGIVFLAWFHRAHLNLPALGARGLTYTSGWAIGAWFVPILNLFR